MNDIINPTLIIDTNVMLSNLDRMIAKSKKNNLIFRPHFKTHQSKNVAAYYREKGIDKITVSSVEMARYFAEDGWNDITIAFPTNIRERNQISELHQSIKLNLIADNPETIKAIDSWNLDGIGLFIEVDAGYHRTGIDIKDEQQLKRLVDLVRSSTSIIWRGFLLHNGHTYKSRGREQIISTHDESQKLFRVLNDYKKVTPEIIISMGDTPAFSVIDQFSGFDEMRPGNFIFYDLAQWQIGSCDISDIAVCMACPVVGIYPERGELVVYGGGVHFSKDRIEIDGKEIFGIPVRINDKGWGEPIKKGYVSSLSQEHGIINLPNSQLVHFNIGDLIGVLPVHSCLAAEASGAYRTLTGQMIDHC